jgi:hypothetical protein
VLSLFHLWRASTLNGIPPWIEPVPGLSAMALDSILAILFSGIHLTIQLAWIDVTMGAFFLMAPLGAVTGKRLRVIRHLSAQVLRRIKQNFSTCCGSVSSGFRWGTRIAVFLGIVLLMTAKPDVLESLSIVGVSVVLGFVAASLIPSGGSER